MSNVSMSVFAHFEQENVIEVTTHLLDSGAFAIGVGDVRLCFASKADATEVLSMLLASTKFTNSMSTYWVNNLRLEEK